MRYQFNKERHIHTLDGKPLCGVTTVLGTIAKPALISWAASMATDHIKSKIKAGKTYEQEYLDGVFAEAKVAHTKKKEKAGDTGTLVHDAVEQFIKKGKLYSGDNKQVSKMFTKFVEWATENKVEFLESEKHVWSENLWIGGIFDFTLVMGGKRYIGDLKTSSNIYPEHFLQMSAYDLCLAEMGDWNYDGYVVVNIDKSATLRVGIQTDREKYREAFKNCLGLYKALK